MQNPLAIILPLRQIQDILTLSCKTAPADGGDLEGSSIDETRRWVWADQRTVRFQRMKPFAAGARLLHTSHS